MFTANPDTTKNMFSAPEKTNKIPKKLEVSINVGKPEVKPQNSLFSNTTLPTEKPLGESLFTNK